jgi:predicted alpha/beta-fold hydrolase
METPHAHTRLLILHGLEGTVRSNYAQGLFREAGERGWSADMLIFRSCSDEMNRTARFYHSGETGDLSLVIDRILDEHGDQSIVLAGMSLGGNVLLKYLGERGSSIDRRIKAAAATSVPYDLDRASRHIGRGFARLYQRHFIRSLKNKATVKLQRFPGLVDPEALNRSRTMYEFDDVVTAPIHGFRDAAHYYAESSAIRWIEKIRIPTLLLSAIDDPFLPMEVFDEVGAIASRNPNLHVEFTRHGGHGGFVSGANPLNPSYYAEPRVCDFLAEHVEENVALPMTGSLRG